MGDELQIAYVRAKHWRAWAGLYSIGGWGVGTWSPGRGRDSGSALRFPTSERLKLSRLPPAVSFLPRTVHVYSHDLSSVFSIDHWSESHWTILSLSLSLELWSSNSGLQRYRYPHTHCNHQCNSSQVIPAHRTEPSPLIMPYLHMHIHHHHHHLAFCHHFFCRAGRRFAGGAERRNSACRLCSNRYDRTYISVGAIRTVGVAFDTRIHTYVLVRRSRLARRLARTRHQEGRTIRSSVRPDLDFGAL
ncbi:hypothetical protein C8Q76DRAFT_26172 [Earliella scabrosa]|nr:hypothetical protein C8Q76DRAFT_26172 [Earliella scabrosa]